LRTELPRSADAPLSKPSLEQPAKRKQLSLDPLSLKPDDAESLDAYIDEVGAMPLGKRFLQAGE
jgi:hypothetical protein